MPKMHCSVRGGDWNWHFDKAELLLVPWDFDPLSLPDPELKKFSPDMLLPFVLDQPLDDVQGARFPDDITPHLRIYSGVRVIHLVDDAIIYCGPPFLAWFLPDGTAGGLFLEPAAASPDQVYAEPYGAAFLGDWILFYLDYEDDAHQELGLMVVVNKTNKEAKLYKVNISSSTIQGQAIDTMGQASDLSIWLQSYMEFPKKIFHKLQPGFPPTVEKAVTFTTLNAFLPYTVKDSWIYSYLYTMISTPGFHTYTRDFETDSYGNQYIVFNGVLQHRTPSGPVRILYNYRHPGQVPFWIGPSTQVSPQGPYQLWTQENFSLVIHPYQNETIMGHSHFGPDAPAPAEYTRDGILNVESTQPDIVDAHLFPHRTVLWRWSQVLTSYWASDSANILLKGEPGPCLCCINNIPFRINEEKYPLLEKGPGVINHPYADLVVRNQYFKTRLLEVPVRNRVIGSSFSATTIPGYGNLVEEMANENPSSSAPTITFEEVNYFTLRPLHFGLIRRSG